MRGHVRKRGSKWSAVVEIGRVDGKRQQKWYSGFRTEKEAEQALTNILAQLDKNEFVSPTELTVGQYLHDWFETYCLTNLAASTYDSYRIILDKHIIPRLGKILLQKLQPMNIQKYYAYAVREGRADGKGGLSNKTVHYHHRVLRQALDHAVRLQIISRNPANLVDPPKPQKFTATFLNEEQIQRFLEMLKGSRVEMPAILAISLGLRRGEVLGLRWEDIDWDRNLLTVNNTLIASKNGLIFKGPKSKESNRTIRLSESILSILRHHKVSQAEKRLMFGQAYKDNGLVYCNDDGSPIVPTTFSYAFTEWSKRNGFTGLRFHDLRHTNATIMLKNKIPPKVASQRLGHSTISITMDLYSHILESMQEEAADKIEEMLWKKTK